MYLNTNQIERLLKMCIISSVSYKNPDYINKYRNMFNGSEGAESEIRSIEGSTTEYGEHVSVLRTIKKTPKFIENNSTNTKCYIFEMDDHIIVSFRGSSTISDIKSEGFNNDILFLLTRRPSHRAPTNYM